MKELDTGREKVKKICDVLRHDTLEPAKREAAEIVERAKREADKIVGQAKIEAEKVHEAVRLENAKQRTAFHASIEQACRQTLELLRQKIEEKFFNQQLKEVLGAEMRKSEVVAGLVRAVIGAVEREGVNTDLSAYIPAAASVEEINQLLCKEILEKLREKSVLLSDLDGGVAVKLHEGNMILDISEETLKELVIRYVRKDFREMLFGQV